MTTRIWFELEEIIALAEKAIKALESSNKDDCTITLAYFRGYLNGAANNPIRKNDVGKT